MTLNSTAKIKAVFGEPGTKNLVTYEIPYTMYFNNGKKLVPVTKITSHKLLKDRILAVLNKVLLVYGHKRIKELGLDVFGGCYNYRLMRGGSELSTHSWGIALDFDPENN